MKLHVERFDYIDSQQLFSCIADRDWAQFFDSGALAHREEISRNSKYDVLVCKPVATIVCDQGSTEVARLNSANQDCKDKSFAYSPQSDPLSTLRELISIELDGFNESLSNEKHLGFLPGAYGYVSYDYARKLEPLPQLAKDDIQLPEVALGIYDSALVVDHIAEEVRLVTMRQDGESFGFWRELLLKIKELAPNASSNFAESAMANESQSGLRSQALGENLDFEAYEQAFNKVQQYIVDGDCYQVNLAKQFSAFVQGDSWQTYCHLRNISPAPYAGFMKFPFAEILSNSPESFIRCRSGKVESSPIKGTSPRDHNDPLNDALIAKTLYNSSKDRAENLMIVDLMRNDLSRCCKANSVKVPELFKLHSFANVHHLISKITGELDEEFDAIDLFKSCFPGGSITGAPKIRAMQIIEELEPDRRGIYCGAMCYFGVDGDMESNIAIRTITVKDGVASYGAGGGLVIDSDAEHEYQEIIDKAKMMKQALFL
jgi:para-aminobenzoate synthetase component 1